MTILRAVSLGVGFVVLAAACGGADLMNRAAGTEPAARRCVEGTFTRLGTSRVAYAAVVERPTVAYRRPGGRRIASFGRLNVNRVSTVFGVRGVVRDARCRPTWYRVQLPVRPNGTEGWVRARNVSLSRVRTRIEIDLSARRVTLFRDGQEALTTVAAIGTPATPTPLGRYYVNQRLIPTNPAGPFGPGAVGISAFSPVLTGWAQGGPIAIHGTNRPSLIGQRVSNGCIRVRNDVLERIFTASLAGTPVVIRR